MLKVLQARLQQYVKQELLGIQAGFRIGRGAREQIAKIHWIIIKAKELQEKKKKKQKLVFRHYLLCQSLQLCGLQ